MNLENGVSFDAAKNKHYGIAIVIGLISIICGLISLSDPPTGIYIYFPMVTIAFGIITLCFFSIFKNMTFVTIIVLAFMFLRYTVSLFILHSEGYPKGIYYISINKGISLETAILMIYEMIMIFLALYIGGRKYKKQIIVSNYQEKLFGKNNFARLNALIVFFVAVTIGIFIIYPSLFNNYSFIFNSELDQITGKIISSQSGLPAGMRWIGYTFGEATRYIIIEYLLLKIYKRYVLIGEKNSRYWWISVIIALANAMITNQRMMIGIFMSLVFFYQIFQLYPKKRKLFRTFGAVIGVIGIILITFTYWTTALSYQSLSQMIQGYTNGFYNVYQSTSAYQNANIGLIGKLEMFFVGDGLGNVNLLSMLISGTNSSDIYNYYIYGSTINGGAVLPFVSQLSFYFSAILGPIFSFMIVLFAKRVENKSLSSEGNVMLSQFCAFVFAATPFMYNYSTDIHILTVVVLPLWVCSLINAMNIKCGKFSGI